MCAQLWRQVSLNSYSKVSHLFMVIYEGPVGGFQGLLNSVKHSTSFDVTTESCFVPVEGCSTKEDVLLLESFNKVGEALIFELGHA